MKPYWTKDELCPILFCSGVMPRDHFLTILKYLHFADSENPPTQDGEDPNYDRLWKIRQIFDVRNSNFSELYHPTVNEVIVKFKGKVVFRQYIPDLAYKFINFVTGLIAHTT
jgi:hypothetical protein